MRTRFFLLLTFVVLAFAGCQKTPYEEEIDEGTEQRGGTSSSDDSGSDEDEDWDDGDYDSETPYVDSDVTDGNDNSGNDDREVTVTQFINAENLSGVYVTGYIVAACYQNKKYADFKPPFEGSSAILLADDPNETDVEKTIAIQLKSGTKMRKTVNLEDHPENHKKRLRVFGYRTDYLGLKGIKDIGANNWELLD